MITCLGLSPALDVTYLLDRFAPGAIHRPREVLALPGGKSHNVARAALALGAAVRAISPLGGFTGARVRAGLGALGELEVVAIDADVETRMCVTVVDDAGTTTELYEHAPALASRAWDALAEAVASAPSGWLAFSGSVPAGAGERIADVLADAAGRGIRVAVDTHGPALRAVLDRSAPALVKVNRHEAAELLGDADATTLARALHERTGATAVVTDGADGAAATDGADVWRAVPPRRGPYAVGSGDSFLAGLLVALDTEPGDLPGALALATAAAAANTLAPGAAVFDPAVAAALRPDVRVGR